MENSVNQMFDILDLLYIFTIPLILYFLLKTERSSRRRLDTIAGEIGRTNQLLEKLNQNNKD